MAKLVKIIISILMSLLKEMDHFIMNIMETDMNKMNFKIFYK